MEDDHARHIVRVYVGSLSQEYEALSVEASKHTTAEEIVQCIVQKLGFSNPNDYELAEVIGNSTGQECKERRIGPYESPVALKLLWPKASETADSLLFPGSAAGVPGSATPPSTAATSASARAAASAAAAAQTASSSSQFSSFSLSSSSSSSFTNHFPNPSAATATTTTGNRNSSSSSSSLSYKSNSQYQQQNGGGSSHSPYSHHASQNNSQSHTAHHYFHQQQQNSSSLSSSDVTSLITDQYRFCLRERLTDSLLWSESSFVMDPQIIRDYFYRFLYQPKDKEYPDLCQLPDLNELTLSENLKSRFNAGHIYTYVGSILIAINPFRFHPIYNPKYVKLYQNRRREELPPHIFAIADSAYHTMLKEKRNQCIVISGESGSGKTESTNFLLHHLTALSQKGSHGSGVEQTILSAGPVLEAFGNAKTAHNNNSSRFGKFIQVSYRENGLVHGAIVQKYLLEKSRICCQAKNERNYHVFYYLLAGANDTERGILNLLPPHKYHYLNQSECYTLDGVDESYEFSRLKQSMEMVGFGPDTQRKLFCVLSAVLLIGNVEFTPKKSSYHHDESVLIQNPAVVRQISHLLRVTEDTLLAALTSKRARVSGEMLVINYRMPEAIAARDAMAKCLYETLFDWIVLQVNHSLLSKKDSSADYNGNSIGVLDIFGFEDFGDCNSFEQFCINYANEHLQHYFNQHVFKYEQEEYKKEGIHWTNIDFMDNTPCLSLIEAKPNGLICILDDQCSFPGATNETLLQKFNSVHKDHEFYQVPQRREAAFIIRHYAGKVKYQVSEFREKNMDLMRHDIVSVLKNSSSAFVRELVGLDPVAVFRWAILRAFFRAYFSFYEAGYRHRKAKVRSSLSRAYSSPARRRSSNDHLIKNEQIIRCHLIKSRNRSSLRPYPTASTPAINGSASLIKNGSSCCGGIHFIGDANNTRGRDIAATATTTATLSHDFSATTMSITPLSSQSSVFQPEESEREHENEIFYGSHHFHNECFDDDAFATSTAFNCRCSSLGNCNFSTARISPSTSPSVKTLSSGSTCSSSSSHYHGEGKNFVRCCCCYPSSTDVPAVSHSHLVGCHADNPFVDSGDPMIMMEDDEDVKEQCLQYHLQQQKKEKNGGDYDDRSSIICSNGSSRASLGGGDPFILTHRKNRSFRMQPMMSRGMKNLQSVKILASQTAVMGVSSKNVNPRKQPLSVSQQFQQSLHSLMITLNQANPFFIRCIKSNSDKTPSKFDDDIVQRQLRYTGMLETVRIRQAGYNVRLTFDEFIHLYRILLPKGLESNKHDVHNFLVSLNLNPLNYQLGASKIFLREIEKIKLDYFLHQQIMASIVRIQRWYRAVLERRQFLRMHDAVIKLQSYMRMYLAQKFVANERIRHLAATFIQKMWRGYSVHKWYEQIRSNVIHFQAKVRGILVRRQYQKMLDEHRRLSKQKEKLQVALRVKTDGDTNSGQSDEAFLSKGSSQEELDENKLKNSLEFEDSEESSGVHEDSEPESAVLSHLVQSLSNVNSPAGCASSDASNSTAAVSTGNISGPMGGASTSPGGPNSNRIFQQTPSLSESMPALTLALSASPFSLLGESSSLSQPLTRRSMSPLNPPDDASQTEPPAVKERTKKKMSLKSRKDKGFGKVVEDEAVLMKEVDTYRDDPEGNRRDDGSSKNPFHRAKKHIKTLITGNSKVKLEKHEAVLLDSGSEGEENAEGISTTTQKSTSNSSSTQSTVTLSENYVEPASLESLIFDQHKMRVTSSPTASTQKLRRESSGASSEHGAGDFMSMPSSYEHVPFGSRMDEFSTMMRQHHQAQKENVPVTNSGSSSSQSKTRRKGSDSLEPSRKSSASSTEQLQQPMSLSHNTHKTARESRSYYGSSGRSSEEIENVRRWATSTSSYDGQLGGGDIREPSVRDSVRNLIGMFADLNTKQPQAHLPLKMYNSSSAQQPGAQESSSSPTNQDGSSSPNKAARTTSIPVGSGGREIRRTRSVSETRQPVHNRREFSLEPSPYVSADFVSADVNPIATDEILPSHVHHGHGSHHHRHSGTTGPKSKTGYHLLEKVTKFPRGEQCGACGKNMHVLFAPGVKCTSCKSTYHSKCVQNGMIQRVPCRNNRQILVFSSVNDENLTTPSSASEKSSSTRRKPKPRKQKTDGDVNPSGTSSSKAGKFSLTGTSEFTDRTDQIISGVKELRQMQEFISNKIYQVSRQKGSAKESRVDRVFEQALREFKESLVSHYSVASKRGDTMPLNIRYKDLIANFTNIMETASKNESMTNDSATTMGVNAFRGFLNEFMNTTRTSSGGGGSEEKPSKVIKQRKERRAKDKGGKRQKVDDAIDHLGHSFVPMVINIPTACEICSSFIMWPIERGVVCQKCKLASHKKCHLKILSECNEHGQVGGGAGNGAQVTGIFGAPLSGLVSDGTSIPLVVDQLITAIELYGLRMEGLYRKSGVSSRQKELKQDIQDGKEIDCELYPVHVLTSVLKSFFREMPEPLLTFELYDEFLRASELSQQEDRINTLFALLKKLPKPNYDLMERLVFHLVRVALCEDKNRMNANSLAIVFAPCILRTNKTRQVQESLHDISRQTLCLETIILEQMKKVKETLSNIESVDTAAHSFSVRLNSIRSSKMQMKTSPDRKKSVGSTGSLSEGSVDIKLIGSSTPESMSAEEEEEYLTQHIKHLQDEKAMLTSVLPSLSRTPSDEDMLSTDPEVDSPGGSVDDVQHGNVSPSPRQVRAQSLQYSKSDSLVTESLHAAGISPGRGAGGTGGSTLLHNLMKNRGPVRKPPSRFVRNLQSVDFGEKEGRSLHYRHHYQHHHHSVSSTGATIVNSSSTNSSTSSSGGNNGISLTDQQQSRQCPASHNEEDESVISVDQNNDEEAILV